MTGYACIHSSGDSLLVSDLLQRCSVMAQVDPHLKIQIVARSRMANFLGRLGIRRSASENNDWRLWGGVCCTRSIKK